MVLYGFKYVSAHSFGLQIASVLISPGFFSVTFGAVYLLEAQSLHHGTQILVTHVAAQGRTSAYALHDFR